VTAREMQGAIGQPLLYVPRCHDSLQFVCRVVDVKVGYGQPRVLITPMAGTGETWVEFGCLRPLPQVVNGRVSADSSCGHLTTGVISATIVKRG
jgi:hypothetical protein